MLLSLLLGRARHAHDIARKVKHLGDGRLPFYCGTLYCMERDGLIASVVDRPEGERMRRVYHLAEKGAAEADRAKIAWNEYANAMNRRAR